jgi:arylsulfatase A-like enzyme
MVLSDHVVMLGEHNVTGKPPWAIWPELTDIVFYMRHPEGEAAGKTSDYYASVHDVAPTILSMTGIQRPEVMNGQDLSVLFDGKEPETRSHFTLGYNNHSWATTTATSW